MVDFIGIVVFGAPDDGPEVNISSVLLLIETEVDCLVIPCSVFTNSNLHPVIEREILSTSAMAHVTKAILVAVGCFNPPTIMHQRLFGEYTVKGLLLWVQLRLVLSLLQRLAGTTLKASGVTATKFWVA